MDRSARDRCPDPPITFDDVSQFVALDGPIDARSKTIKNHGQKSTLRLLKTLGAGQNVTLLCHCDEHATECHRFLLEKAIAKA